MGELFKQKVAIVVAFGILSLLIFFISVAKYTNTLNEELNNYSYKVSTYIDLLMNQAKSRNESVIDYAISDEYFNDSYENIIAKQHEDDYITTLCKEVKSIVSSIQTALVIMENGEVYSSDNTFESYIEQFKNIKNSEFYKDTCMENSYKVNKYNKYYNVECYSYSNAIFDKDGRRVGTFIVTYTLNEHWNEINSLNKDDFMGTVIFETQDKQILSIIDENGVESHTENELIADRAYQLIDDAQAMYKLYNKEREYYTYFIANDNVILEVFNTVRLISTIVTLVVLIFIILLTYRRKEKYIFEIATITIVAIAIFIALWGGFTSSYYNAETMKSKINKYLDSKWQQETEFLFDIGIEAFSDYIQTTILEDTSNKLTTNEFTEVLASKLLNADKDKYNKIKRYFSYGKPTYVFIDNNEKINFESNVIVPTTQLEKEAYNKLIKSGDSKSYTVGYENDEAIKTMYYKTRILSKYTVVFEVEYNLKNFYNNNANERMNIGELGETYFVTYYDGFKIALIRANEISDIKNLHTLEYVEVEDDIFDGHIKEFVEEGLEFKVYNQVNFIGNMNKMLCFNNKDLSRVEVYFVIDKTIMECKKMITLSILTNVGLFFTLLLYNYLESRRVKQKDKKEEIVLHGNY